MGDKEKKDVDLEFNLDFNEGEATQVDPKPSSKQNKAPEMVELALKANAEEEANETIPLDKGMDGIQLELSDKDTQEIEGKAQVNSAGIVKEDPTEISFDNNEAASKIEGVEEGPIGADSNSSEENKSKLSFDSLDDMKEETAEIELPSELSQNNAAIPAENQTEVSGGEIQQEQSIQFHNSDNLTQSKGPVAPKEESVEESEESLLSASVTSASIHGDESDMLRLQSTIRQLREEQKYLREENKKEKKGKKGFEQDILSLQAELDEVKIENTILKKRHSDQINELNNRVRVSDDKKLIMEKKMKNYQKEFEKIDQKVRIDISQVKQREKELENQLELTSMDSEAQVSSRDGKIIELKQKIDMLEFNIENISIRERKSVEDKKNLEEKAGEVLKVLRDAVVTLENSMNSEEEMIHKLAKVANG